MPTATSTTRWRNQAVVPASYDDIPALVRIARRLRREIVEFDWAFRRDELLSLRRAVFEWGSSVRGIYKCFDSRVLVAINGALGEPGSIFGLREPRGFESVDCHASCVPEDDLFRLRGHATFDLVFGYAEAGVREAGAGYALLLPTVRTTLAASREALGWDVLRLQDGEYRPLRNVLYGMPPSYGSGYDAPPRGPEQQVAVAFAGPFAATYDTGCRCLFTDPMATETGVHLWTVCVDGAEMPWYVGQTRRGFGQRMAEHMAAFISGQYPPQDPAALARGVNQLADGAVTGEWPQTLAAFLHGWERLVPNIVALIRLLRFHVAPLVGDDNRHNRVEGAIGRCLKTHPAPAIREFFSPGVRLPAATPGAQRLRLRLATEVPILGLPLEILDPRTPLPLEVRHFVESSTWTCATTYASSWPHEYLVRKPENTAMMLALAQHIFEHGVAGRFYSQERRYHHERGKVYWSMDETAEATTLINRCDETQMFEARQAARALPAD